MKDSKKSSLFRSETVDAAVELAAKQFAELEMDFVEPNPLEDVLRQLELSEQSLELNLIDTAEIEKAQKDAQIEAAHFEGDQELEASHQEIPQHEAEVTSELTLIQEQRFVEDQELLSILESALFIAEKPMTVASLEVVFAQTNIDKQRIRQGLDELAQKYAAPEHGIMLVEVGGGYQLRTKTDNADYLLRLQKTRPFRLSGAALEVMSIIAYKQPLVKAEVDEIRGVESGHLVRALMDRGLVSFQGKSDLPGKPMLYGTTKKFLEIFGLRNIKELPTLSEIDEILPDGIDADGETESLSDLTDALSEQLLESYSKEESELELITSQITQIQTTTDFFEQEKMNERQLRDQQKAEDLSMRLSAGEELSSRDKNWLEKFRLASVDEQEPVL